MRPASRCSSPDHTSLRLLGVEEFPPGLRGVLATSGGWSGSTCSKALSDNARVVIADIEACDFMAGTQDLQEYVARESAPCNRRRCDRDRAGLSACSRRTGGRRIARPKRTSVLRRARPAGRGSDRAHPRRSGPARKRRTLPPHRGYRSGDDLDVRRRDNRSRISIRSGSITRASHWIRPWDSDRSTSSTQTKQRNAAMSIGRLSSSVSRFRWSIGSVVTTASIAGW